MVRNDQENGGMVYEKKNGRLWGDIPHIKLEIVGDECICSADTEYYVCVMSEKLFQSLRLKDKKMLILFTSGVKYSGALKKKINRE